MSDPRYDDATLRMVAELSSWEDPWAGAEKILAALATAGLLLPPGGETREEWAVWWHTDRGGVAQTEASFSSRSTAEKAAPGYIGKYGITSYSLHRRVWTTWPDGSAHCSPWEEVTDEHPA